MRVVCDNCGASYKIPDSKLTRDVNKATCRKCGNPILIRRPDQPPAAPAAGEPEAAAEERTLITSAAELERQARTRGGPAMDEASMDPRPTQVSPDNSGAEATVPRYDVLPGVPTPERVERDTVVQAPPPEPPPPFIPAASPFPPPPGGAPSPPPPPPPRAAAPPPTPAPIRPVAPPPPPPPVAAPAAVHDARGDLTFAALLALLGVFGALLNVGGALVGISAIGSVGTFVSVFGAAGAALVILTGGRGTRPASIVLGGAGGFFLAVILGLAHFVAAGGLSGVSEPRPAAAVAPAPSPVVPTPPAAPVPVPTPAPVEAAVTPPPPEAPAPVEAPAPAEAPKPVEAPPPAEAPRPAAKPAEAPRPAAKPAEAPAPAPERITPKTESSGTSKSSSSSSSKSSSSSSSTKTTSTPSTSTSSKAATLDTRVIDTMMKSNKGVKLCYIKEQKASGELPNNVKVKMTVQPSGSVSAAKIPSGDWKDTDFDGCLSSAVKGIAFPPFEGDPLSLTYAFPNF